ncbi:Thiol oxidoreductase [Candidatus Filomicrobium marinum]|uniref:Thiol oxidoreductase n=1 Tax=Candidatus Filomicrobium marinum TaxID=1608628 RepID=A0A0D6JFB0_9HYPH|nr:di-heme oxidoredictase family protein [Candidatus Filomicrobium marinum]CFX26012.1 Thiol oxidoreductase [Candidatus Filomicrobium marinum]CPR19378.1 Thiol oxidoreductase [Candidatus Filomicrobium marinum]
MAKIDTSDIPSLRRSRFWPFGIALTGAAVVLAAASLAAPVDDKASIGKFEPGEEFPGGTATTRQSRDHVNAFSHFSNGIGFEGEARFKLGNAIFRKEWVSSPASTKASDGLGPLYNARGCQSCHLKDGRGHPPAANWPDDDAISMFLRLSVSPSTDQERQLLKERRVNVIAEPTYGGQLQDIAIKGHAAEGHMKITYEDVPVPFADGTSVTLRKPSYEITDLAYGPLQPDVMTSPRIAPPMIGLGLLEAIPEEVIRANADPDDANGDGISGRAQEVWSLRDRDVRLGRFGWKGGTPSVAQQSAEAFAGDMGLSTSLVPKSSGDCTAAQAVCLDAPNGNSPKPSDPEVGDQLFDLLVFYSQNLAVPGRPNASEPLVLEGKVKFHELGCAACHIPSFTTGEVSGQPHLSGHRIWPYTDLLLHDMGEGLADGRPEGLASGQEWRTPPLWGIGATEVVSGHTNFLHDGRARNVEEAILWHGGEAQAARDAYTQLSKDQRDALLAFVNSL